MACRTAVKTPDSLSTWEAPKTNSALRLRLSHAWPFHDPMVASGDDQRGLLWRTLNHGRDGRPRRLQTTSRPRTLIPTGNMSLPSPRPPPQRVSDNGLVRDRCTSRCQTGGGGGADAL